MAVTRQDCGTICQFSRNDLGDRNHGERNASTISVSPAGTAPPATGVPATKGTTARRHACGRIWLIFRPLRPSSRRRSFSPHRTAAMKTLILPVDIKSREFDARLLHAAFALQRGWRVIVGSKTLINRAIWHLPRGVYLFSTVGRSRIRNARRLRRMGFASQGWDEEGLVYGDRALYRRQRLYAPTMALVDQLFAWGEESARDMRIVAEQAGKDV
ncbi:MAG TPA: hypothetical protein ENK13_04160, partial [Thermopetrobacter sp.]|nr:hypothetical protein [Thermopetrobacter sp.]